MLRVLNEKLDKLQRLLSEEHEDAQRRAKELASQGKSKSEIRRAILDEFPGVPINKGLDIADQAAANPGRSVPKGGMAAHATGVSDVTLLKKALEGLVDAVFAWYIDPSLVSADDDKELLEVYIENLQDWLRSDNDVESLCGDVLRGLGYLDGATRGKMMPPDESTQDLVSDAYREAYKALGSVKSWSSPDDLKLLPIELDWDY